ncbi:hypothetical protein [Desulfobacter postgatei]|uniref:hypothetical protein n=1 Tax=Desulfobacter postgatei TaxID=2293 RepID=UPI000586C087|nr:hypothetical protein [Desulfobacter postgatei]
MAITISITINVGTTAGAEAETGPRCRVRTGHVTPDGRAAITIMITAIINTINTTGGRQKTQNIGPKRIHVGTTKTNIKTTFSAGTHGIMKRTSPKDIHTTKTGVERILVGYNESILLGYKKIKCQKRDDVIK